MTHWNQIYQKHKNGFSSKSDYWPELIDYFKKKEVTTVLDVGCGTGSHMIDLAENGFEAAGLDISEEAIRLAQEKFEEKNLSAAFKVGSMHKVFPFKNKSFDAAISLRTINHGTKKQIEFTINEIYRVLKPGGHLFLTTIKILGKKKILGKTKLNQMPVKIIAPYTYQPLEGKEVGVTHFMFNKKTIKEMFDQFQIKDIWVEHGEKKWEKYYCLLAQKPS